MVVKSMNKSGIQAMTKNSVKKHRESKKKYEK